MAFIDNLTRINQRIAQACARARRDAKDIQLVAVSKTVPLEKVCESLDSGITVIAESRIQEASFKFPHFEGRSLTKHLIGHLQTNKAKKAVELFDIIQSLDSIRLANALNRHARDRGKIQECYLEVKLSTEETKHGITEGELEAVARQCAALPGITITGIMVMAPYFDDPEEARPYFTKARELFEKTQKLDIFPSLKTLSMGMSHDFEVAIEEGATMVRVGTALYA